MTGEGEEGQFGLNDICKRPGEVGGKDAPCMSCVTVLHGDKQKENMTLLLVTWSSPGEK